MEDLSALAARLAAGVGDVRGCLIVSRDGLVMGAHPEDAEVQLRPAWLRFAALGEPDRSFVQFGDEIWCYVRRGAYAAFLVTSVAIRPGLAIDQIEQALHTAEEARSKRESAGANEPDPDAPAAPPIPRDPSGGAVWARRSDDVREDGRDEEVDRVLLAREFSRLLQEDENGADG